jgi:uncharacterized membrane protein YqjE
MGSASGEGPAPAVSAAGLPPANWREALMGLVSSRLALIELEAKDAAKSGVRRVVFLVGVCGCLFFTWALLLVGLVPLIADATGWPWSKVALGAAGVHLLVALIFYKLAKPSEAPSFPVTRTEFQKDREWIENFQKTKKSNG